MKLTRVCEQVRLPISILQPLDVLRAWARVDHRRVSCLKELPVNVRLTGQLLDEVFHAIEHESQRVIERWSCGCEVEVLDSRLIVFLDGEGSAA